VDVPSLKAIGASMFRFTDEWYAIKNFNCDMRVLLVQETEEMKKDGGNACYDRPPYPSTWIRKEGKGHVAYTAFGHDNERWKSPLVQSVFSDLIAFVTGKIVLDLTPNFDKVCPQGEILKNK
ncbi:MAG: ThuA domain-containing protein, partial [Planctomycetaceae bacterium]|nr:ThuA domain-containing protein [Planctomycetaceae bacterium]